MQNNALWKHFAVHIHTQHTYDVYSFCHMHYNNMEINDGQLFFSFSYCAAHAFVHSAHKQRQHYYTFHLWVSMAHALPSLH